MKTLALVLINIYLITNSAEIIHTLIGDSYFGNCIYIYTFVSGHIQDGAKADL